MNEKFPIQNGKVLLHEANRHFLKITREEVLESCEETIIVAFSSRVRKQFTNT